MLLVYFAKSIDNGEWVKCIRLMDDMEFSYEHNDKMANNRQSLRD